MSIRRCLFCNKELTNRNQRKFCSHSCAAQYNNSKRKLKRGKTKIKHCIECGKEIEVSIYSSQKSWYCDEHDKRKNKSVHTKDITYVKSILEFSKRTAVKILKRMGAVCSICGWSESTCDIHHIIPRKNGGNDDMENLIYICPNCHRLCHTTDKFTEEFLKEHSIANKYRDWKNFYHPSN